MPTHNNNKRENSKDTVVQDTRTFEQSVLSRLLAQQYAGLKDAQSNRGLVPPSTLLGLGLYVSKSVRLMGLQITVGDVVLLHNQIGEVKLCCDQRGRLLLLVDILAGTPQISEHSWRADNSTRERGIWAVEEVSIAVAWYGDVDAVIVVAR